MSEHQHSAEYLAYLKSSEWQERRQARLKKANYKCEQCGEREGLEVHHKTYSNLFDEPLDDLITLCRSCHWEADQKRKNANKIKSKLSRINPREQISPRAKKRGKRGRWIVLKSIYFVALRLIDKRTAAEQEAH